MARRRKKPGYPATVEDRQRLFEEARELVARANELVKHAAELLHDARNTRGASEFLKIVGRDPSARRR